MERIIPLPSVLQIGDIMQIKLTFPSWLDQQITLYLHQLWAKNCHFDSLAITITRWTPIVMLIIVAGVSQNILLPEPNRPISFQFATLAVVAALLARAVNEPIAKFVSRPRPFEELPIVPLLEHESGESFPSNHATGAFALAVGCIHVPGYSVLLLVLSVCLAFSRVYCGLHYASDVVLGALHGIFAGCFCLWLSHWVWL